MVENREHRARGRKVKENNTTALRAFASSLTEQEGLSM
jgi:hypothetical protein